MQSLTEFLKRIQTFNLSISKQSIYYKPFSAETQEQEGYDISQETQYYTSFSYKSELRILRDMALIDLLSLDEHRIRLQLVQLNKVKELFKQIWGNYHEHYREYSEVYKPTYLLEIKLDFLFVVNNIRSTDENLVISSKFVEDLCDSLKLRERSLKELIEQVKSLLPEYRSEYEQFKIEQEKQRLDEEKQKREQEKRNEQLGEHNPQVETLKVVNRTPIFTEGTAQQFYAILKSYFQQEEHPLLAGLLLNNKTPKLPLIFRGNGNQLADAFKQLFDANMIVGCQQADLEKWIVSKFVYLLNQDEPREFTEGYLNGLISTKSRPCKSPILQVDQKNNNFTILPVVRNKKLNH